MVARMVTQTSVWPKPPQTGHSQTGIQSLWGAQRWKQAKPFVVFYYTDAPLCARRVATTDAPVPRALGLGQKPTPLRLHHYHHVAAWRAGLAGNGPVPKVDRTNTQTYLHGISLESIRNALILHRHLVSTEKGSLSWGRARGPFRADGDPWHASSTANGGAPWSARRDCRSWHKETAVKR